MRARTLVASMVLLSLCGSGRGASGAPQGAEHAPQRTGETIASLLAAAPEGATVQVGPGVYHEHLRIVKRVTLIGSGSAIIDGDGRGDIIEIVVPDVTVRGFTVRNTGIDLEAENVAIRVLAPRAVLENNLLDDVLFGIDLREAPGSIVRGNRIGGKTLDIARRGDGLRLWRCDHATIERNDIHDGRDAILWYSRGVIVRGNHSEACRYGLHLMFSDDVTIEDNVLSGNSVGIYLMYSTDVTISRNQLLNNRGPSGYGIGLKETDRFSVQDNLIVGNRSGIYIDGSPFTPQVPGEYTRNTIAYNDIGITFLPSARNNVLAENSFIDNINQISVAGRGDLSANRFWKGERGNYWSDYTGYDRNEDGVGDFVHEPQTFFENMIEKEPSLRLFLFSPAQQAIEFVGRAVPAVRPEPKFSDEVPLMRPVASRLDISSGHGSTVPLAGAGVALVIVAGGLISSVQRDFRANGQARNGEGLR